jgi:tetratricopeptide (TPR) repeat protein
MGWRKVPLLGLCGVLALAGCNREQSSIPVNPSAPGQITFAPPDAPAKKEADKPAPALPAHVLASWADFTASEACKPGLSPLQVGEMRNKARLTYQRALTSDPQYLPAYQGLAKLYVDLDDLGHAAETYEKALKLQPNNARLWHEYGMVYARAQNWPAALERLARASDLDPENRLYVNTLGYTYARAGKTQEALATFRRVGTEAVAYYNLGRMLQHMQQTEAAKQCAAAALQLNPQFEAARDLWARLEGNVNSVDVQRVGYQQQPPPSEADLYPPAGEVPFAPQPPRPLVPPQRFAPQEPPVMPAPPTFMPQN